MKKRILFISDWPDNFKNIKVLQALLDKDYSDNYEWTVWSCKKKEDSKLLYRWYCYAKGALYAIKRRKGYDAIFIWQQMIAFILFEILRILPLKIPKVVFSTYINDSNIIFRNFRKHLLQNALKRSEAVVWPSLEMLNEVRKEYPEFEHKNHFTLMPIFDIIDLSLPVNKELDDPYFRNGVYTAGMSERDFDIVIRAFRNTQIPVTIVCPDGYPITETNITRNIRILRFSQVPHAQYYALAGQAFCILISVTSEKSPCGLILIAYAMANSIPVIVTNSYGVKEFIVDGVNGILFKLGKEDEILKGYQRLKDDDAFRIEVIRNAKNTAMEMSPGHFIEKITKILEN